MIFNFECSGTSLLAYILIDFNELEPLSLLYGNIKQWILLLLPEAFWSVDGTFLLSLITLYLHGVDRSLCGSELFYIQVLLSDINLLNIYHRL